MRDGKPFAVRSIVRTVKSSTARCTSAGTTWPSTIGCTKRSIELHGGGDTKLMVALGHYCAERDLSTVHRILARVAVAAYFLRKYTSFWRRYQDTGDWVIVREGDRRIRATLDGVGLELSSILRGGSPRTSSASW